MVAFEDFAVMVGLGGPFTSLAWTRLPISWISGWKYLLYQVNFHSSFLSLYSMSTCILSLWPICPCSSWTGYVHTKDCVSGNKLCIVLAFEFEFVCKEMTLADRQLMGSWWACGTGSHVQLCILYFSLPFESVLDCWWLNWILWQMLQWCKWNSCWNISTFGELWPPHSGTIMLSDNSYSHC